MPSTLTSDVYNEAELIFQILEHKDRKLISYLDCLTLLRGMGMNPTTADMDDLHETMKEPIAKLEAIRLEEERKREKERKALEKKDPKKEKAEKEKAEKEKAEKEKAEAEAEKDGQPKKKVLAEPAEEIKNIDWNIFIHAVEPIYKDNEAEQEEIIAALRVFDTTGKGKLTRSELLKAVTESGESVLSPAEVKQLKEAFPNDVIEFEEFAQRLQGTYTGPTPEQIAAKAEKERQERDEAAKAAASANATDDLLSGVTLGSPASPPQSAPTAETPSTPATSTA